jgi:glycyl-tRNA synthetase
MYAVSASQSNNTNGVDFLRPELAQGIFSNIHRIIKYLNKDKLPFGISQIGKSFRREISTSYTRLREFTQAEIEYLIDPINNYHPKYDSIRNIEIPLLTNNMQLKHQSVIYISIDDAINNEYISDQNIGYYLGRIYQFAIDIGLNEKLIRFRQHLNNELSHYAKDCWDLETFINNKWLECIGLANRGTYDIMSHSRLTNQNPNICRRKLDQPIINRQINLNINNKIIINKYNKNCNTILTYLRNMKQSDINTMKNTLDNNDFYIISIEDMIYKITSDMVSFEEIIRKVEYESFIPHIIEPSFGIDRLIYSILYHNYYIRSDSKTVLGLPYMLSPYNIAIFSLLNKDELNKIKDNVLQLCKNNGFQCYTTSPSIKIGKKYVRADQIGINYSLTIDMDTLKDNTVSIRYRDTMIQGRISIDDLIEYLKSIK